MAIYIQQNVLNGGEISPLMYGRTDQPRYQTGAYIMRNAVPLPQGGVCRRPGTIFCGMAKDQSLGHNGNRLVPFVFDGNYRMLEFYDRGMRVWYADGARVTTATEPYELVLPYARQHIAGLSFAQSADVIYVASTHYPPAKILRYGDTDWRYEVLTFLPKTSTPAAPTLKAGGDVPGSGNQVYSYKIVAVNAATGELSLASAATDINCSSLSTTYYVDVNFTAVAGCDEYRIYKRKAGVYGFIGRAYAGNLTFRDANIGPDLGDTPVNKKTPFNTALDYPSLVFFHQQRLGFASTHNKPLTLWLSQSANFENLGASLPPRDDEGMEATIAGQRQSRILWCESDNKVLIIGTTGGEWLMEAAQSGVFSPSNHGFSPQSEMGSAPMPALRAGGGVLFVQRGGSAVRMMGYSLSDDKYMPQDLSLLASHILQDKQITSWGWQSLPYGIVWASLSDGTLAGLTLLKEHDVIGWHRHDTDGYIESVCVLPSTAGEYDLVWLLVVRKISGKPCRFVEIMAPFFASDDKETAYFVDAGVSVFEPTSEILGLEHLEGRKVSIFSDGHVHPAGLVAGGKAELDYEVKVAHAGLAYTTEIRPTTPEPQLPDGSSMGRLKKISSVKVRVYQTLGFTVSEGTLQATEGSYGTFAIPQERLPHFKIVADIDVSIGGGWSGDSFITLQITDPTPACFLAIISTIEIASGGKGHQL